MEERNYQVQEAVRLIGVESHVLRYWEEELGITVGRTKQGYRLYSEENIRLFQQVKELKAQGIGLKAIRLLLGGADDTGMSGRERLMASLTQAGTPERETVQDAEAEKERGVPGDGAAVRPERETVQDAEAEKEHGVPGDGAAEAQERETGEESEEPLEYEVITNESETMDKFEKILKRIIREAVADQNQKLELAVTDLIREELELQLDAILDAMREAAAQREEEKGGLWKRIRHHLGSKKGHPF